LPMKPEDDPVDVAKRFPIGSAELLIAGMARAQDLGYEKTFGGASSFRASVTFRAIEVRTGEILASVSQTASDLEDKPTVAASKALEKAGALAAKDLAGLPQELAERSRLDLVISGLKSFETLANFQKSLAAETGVKGLFLRAYSQESGVATLDVFIDHVSPQELADRCVKIGGSDWSVFQVSDRSVQLSASQAGR
jgi:hypothetical protein